MVGLQAASQHFPVPLLISRPTSTYLTLFDMILEIVFSIEATLDR